MKEIFEEAKKKGLLELQITKREQIVNSVDVKNEVVTDVSYGESVFYDVKAIDDGKTVMFTVNDLNSDMIIDRIKKLASVIQNDEADRIIASGKITCKRREYDMGINKYQEILTGIYDKYKNDKIKMINSYYEKCINRVTIMNSNGVCLEDENKSDFFYIGVTTSDGDNVVSYDKQMYNPTDEEMESLASLVVTTAMDKLNQEHLVKVNR